MSKLTYLQRQFRLTSDCEKQYGTARNRDCERDGERDPSHGRQKAAVLFLGVLLSIAAGALVDTLSGAG